MAPDDVASNHGHPPGPTAFPPLSCNSHRGSIARALRSGGGCGPSSPSYSAPNAAASPSAIHVYSVGNLFWEETWFAPPGGRGRSPRRERHRGGEDTVEGTLAAASPSAIRVRGRYGNLYTHWTR